MGGDFNKCLAKIHKQHRCCFFMYVTEAGRSSLLLSVMCHQYHQLANWYMLVVHSQVKQLVLAVLSRISFFSHQFWIPTAASGA